METRGSLPSQQGPATGLNSEPDESGPHAQSYFSKVNIYIISHLHLCLPYGLFPSGFPTKTLYEHVTYVCNGSKYRTSHLTYSIYIHEK
jgi:hypothetical protein